MFSKYGPVSDVYIPVDYYTRRFRGFAYVQYPYFLLLMSCCWLINLLFYLFTGQYLYKLLVSYTEIDFFVL